MLFPPTCPICQTIFAQHEQHGCCARCLAGIKVISQHHCTACGIPMLASLAPGPCGRCLRQPLPQQSTQSLYVYRDAVRQAILAWKLQGQSTGVSWLFKASQRNLKQTFSHHDILIPVPMPIHRMRRSGLHHSADLCHKISVITGATMHWKLLRRVGKQQRQSAIHGKARHHNLRKAFALDNDYKAKLNMPNKQGKIWVVDDILTTGATLRHACQAMQSMNRPIFAFSLARTLKNDQES